MNNTNDLNGYILGKTEPYNHKSNLVGYLLSPAIRKAKRKKSTFKIFLPDILISPVQCYSQPVSRGLCPAAVSDCLPVSLAICAEL